MMMMVTILVMTLGICSIPEDSKVKDKSSVVLRGLYGSLPNGGRGVAGLD